MNGFLIACAVTCCVLVVIGMGAAIVRAHRMARNCCAAAAAIMVAVYLVVLV